MTIYSIKDKSEGNWPAKFSPTVGKSSTGSTPALRKILFFKYKKRFMSKKAEKKERNEK